MSFSSKNSVIISVQKFISPICHLLVIFSSLFSFLFSSKYVLAYGILEKKQRFLQFLRRYVRIVVCWIFSRQYKKVFAMKSFFQKLAKRRSPFFWLSTCFFSIFTLWLISQIFFVYLPQFSQAIMPRIPQINDNRNVILEVFWDGLQEDPYIQNRFQVGTAVYQLQPELLLVGFVSKREKLSPDVWRFHLDIIKKNEGILRDDTRFEVLHTSPNLLAIVGRFLSEERTDLLKEQMRHLAERNKEKMSLVFTQISESLSERLQNKQIGNRIMEDDKVRQIILDVLKVEIFTRIDSDKIWESIGDNPKTKVLKNLVKDNINWRGVFTKGLGEGIKGGFDGASGMFDPDYLPEGGVGSVMKMFSNLWDITVNPKKFAKRVLTSSLESAGEGALVVTLEELRRVVKENDETIAKHGSDILQKTAQEIQLSDKVSVGFRALANSNTLRDHIKNRYGNEAWKALQETFLQISQDDQVIKTIGEVSQEIQNLGRDWVEKFALNDKQNGPNPLLLMAVKEGVSQHAEPQIICYPGKGLLVAPKHIYQTKNANQ